MDRSRRVAVGSFCGVLSGCFGSFLGLGVLPRILMFLGLDDRLLVHPSSLF